MFHIWPSLTSFECFVLLYYLLRAHDLVAGMLHSRLQDRGFNAYLMLLWRVEYRAPVQMDRGRYILTTINKSCVLFIRRLQPREAIILSSMTPTYFKTTTCKWDYLLCLAKGCINITCFSVCGLVSIIIYYNRIW